MDGQVPPERPRLRQERFLRDREHRLSRRADLPGYPALEVLLSCAALASRSATESAGKPWSAALVATASVVPGWRSGFRFDCGPQGGPSQLLWEDQLRDRPSAIATLARHEAVSEAIRIFGL